MATMTHEAYISRVAALAIAQANLNADESLLMESIKLVYGAGESGLRGITYYNRWQPTSKEPRPFVEICAFGQSSWVQIAGTTIHELGHVLAGWNAGHGAEWKAACKRLGLRGIKAAGTCYHKACFEQGLRFAIERLPLPSDGEPLTSINGANGISILGTGSPAITMKPCPAGYGTRGGKSRGTGSGSRYRLWECACQPPIKLRCATNHLRAHCDDCTRPFQLISK